jgi:hypothetical protein
VGVGGSNPLVPTKIFGSSGRPGDGRPKISQAQAREAIFSSDEI